jgi:hypothetical protein
MGSLEPIINLVTVLTVLSVTAERLTNVIKLRREDEWKALPNRQREFRITRTNMLVGVALALVMKADLFAMLAQPNAPWSTLGWTTWNGSAWVRSVAAASWGGATHAVLGATLTGAALGFGSQFWHDILEIILEMKKLSEGRAALAVRDAGGVAAVEKHKERGSDA